MIQKLRWKFVLINMLIVTVILFALCVVMVVTTQDSLRKDSLSLLYQAVTEDFDFTWPHHVPDSYTSEGVALPYFTVSVSRSGATALLENQFGVVEDSDQLLEIVKACLQNQSETGVLSEYQLRYFRVDYLLGWRIAFADISQEESTIRSLIFNLICIGSVTLVAFFFISLALARWAVRPVERSWLQQKQFVSDASHELKTPLTVILSNVDMLSGQQNLDQRERRWLDNIRASSSQMTQLVEELLTLARSDNPAAKGQVKERFSLSELVMDSVLCFEPILYEAGKELTEEVEDDLFVIGDPSKLRQLVEILLDNARKYAAENSIVTLRLQSEGAKRVRLSVNTKGEPLSPEQLERIFERFYRADQARTSEGFGLGLPIAARFAAEHGGRLWAESSPENGNTFLFSMPREKG